MKMGSQAQFKALQSPSVNVSGLLGWTNTASSLPLARGEKVERLNEPLVTTTVMLRR